MASIISYHMDCLQTCWMMTSKTIASVLRKFLMLKDWNLGQDGWKGVNQELYQTFPTVQIWHHHRLEKFLNPKCIEYPLRGTSVSLKCLYWDNFFVIIESFDLFFFFLRKSDLKYIENKTFILSSICNLVIFSIIKYYNIS